MAAAKTPQKETSPKAAKPATGNKTEGKGGASSSRSAKGGEKKTTGGK